MRGPAALVVAHPDDETVSAGGLLPSLKDPVLIYVTNGSPRNFSDAAAAGCRTREEYAALRAAELRNALELAGIPPDRSLSLGIPDQDASTNLAYGARRLAEYLESWPSDVILTHPYEGGHPDHDSSAFMTHAATALLPARPRIFEFTSYHAAVGEPRLETGCFVSGCEGEPLPLDPTARERKTRMTACFTSQLHMLRHFRLEPERFRPAPAYDFTAPPHAGALYYEHFPWGMTGPRWRELAAAALEELGLFGPI